MLSTPIVLESLDSPLLLEIAAFCPGLLEVSSHLLAVECFFALLVGIFVVPSLTNGMKVMPVFHLGCFFLRSNSSMWASSRKTVSWRHLYLY